jgi:hypothetical protein
MTLPKTASWYLHSRPGVYGDLAHGDDGGGHVQLQAWVGCRTRHSQADRVLRAAWKVEAVLGSA